MSNPIPLYRDARVTVWPDFEGNGRTVIVQYNNVEVTSIGLTCEWGERIRRYSAGLYQFVNVLAYDGYDDPKFIVALDALNRTLEALSKQGGVKC